MEGAEVLLLFDADHPCWDGPLVELAGEDSGILQVLVEDGFLIPLERGYCLAPKGREAFRELAAENFLEALPGDVSDDLPRDLARNRLELLLDRSFLGRWGQKEMHPRARLPLFPDLSGEALCSCEGNCWKWTYPEHPLYREFDTAFPAYAVAAPPPPITSFEAWKNQHDAPEGDLEADLLLIHRYDFEIYMKYPAQPNDRLNFLNTDRFFFRFIEGDCRGRMREMMEEVGRLHLALLLQRRVLLPWYFDVDNEEQDSVFWWFWVTETEGEAQELVRFFGPHGPMLIDPARPFEVWALSMEALESVGERRETLWDLMEDIGHPVARCTGVG